MGHNVLLVFKGAVSFYINYWILIKVLARRVLKKWFCDQLFYVYLL